MRDPAGNGGTRSCSSTGSGPSNTPASLAAPGLRPPGACTDLYDGRRSLTTSIAAVDGGLFVEIDRYVGSRSKLRHLFELAEDSQSQLDEYLDQGQVMVARQGAAVLGHLQLVPTGLAGEIELKNMAVLPDQRGTGVGRALVESALRRSKAEGWSQMVVASAAADTGNLRFYQRVGFRLLSVERDAFTPESGYPDPILIDGIPLLDRVWLSQELTDNPGGSRVSPLR